MAAKFSPPCLRKISAFSTAISSSVSRQSAAKPGVITARFFTPRSASAFTVWSVQGCSHSARPKRDWKVSSSFDFVETEPLRATAASVSRQWQ